MLANPTQRTYSSLTAAYDFFSRELFGGQLPPCLITVQRHKGAYGYFSGKRFVNVADPEEVTDEIALNPTRFAMRSPEEVLATLVHEMVHLWQHHFGKRPRRSYHDRQWAAVNHRPQVQSDRRQYYKGRSSAILQIRIVRLTFLHSAARLLETRRRGWISRSGF